MRVPTTHCNILQHTATHCDVQIISCCLRISQSDALRASSCNTLQHFLQHNPTLPATHSNTLQYCKQIISSPFTAVSHYLPSSCVFLKHTATHCLTLSRTAIHCSTLPHTTTHCNTLLHTMLHTTAHCNTLQHSAAHYSTM